MALFAGLMKDRSMSYTEILSHSLPFLEAMSGEINRIRIIEAGGNPDRDDDEDTESEITERPSRNNSKNVECNEPDDLFYGTLNELLR